MSVTDQNLIKLGSSYTGLTLYAILCDPDGNAVSGKIYTSFVEIGGGDYYWTYSGFPNSFVGYAKIYDDATDDYLTSVMLFVGTLIAQAQGNQTLASLSETEIIALTSQALEIIEKWLCRTFSLDVYTDTYNGDGTRSLFLRTYPVVEIQEIAITACNTTDIYAPETGQVIPDGFTVDFSSGEVQISCGVGNAFTKGFQNIEITYLAGYTSLPQAIVEATIQLAAWLYSMSQKDPTLKSEGFPDGYSYSLNNSIELGIPPIVKQLLSGYKRYVI